MGNAVRWHSWLKGQSALRAFISLCILAIFVPELSRAISPDLSPISISPYTKQDALLPTAFASGAADRLLRDRRNDEPLWKSAAAASAAAAFWVRRNPVPGGGHVSHYVNPSGVIARKWLRRAYQLLDIPPPPHTVSAWR